MLFIYFESAVLLAIADTIPLQLHLIFGSSTRLHYVAVPRARTLVVETL